MRFTRICKSALRARRRWMRRGLIRRSFSRRLGAIHKPARKAATPSQRPAAAAAPVRQAARAAALALAQAVLLQLEAVAHQPLPPDPPRQVAPRPTRRTVRSLDWVSVSSGLLWRLRWAV
ncbi:hypothetical protein CVT26_004013 [Gymnopilus dilepis]|uniref:Uncharacterized protein n=1 Tax=Gymnopilus dilepis TaxID=231916 RepID=A0A409W211_9AGAR|nr:hypothetical protein CVT26_004013 [Gymnopilus dilepis]